MAIQTARNIAQDHQERVVSQRIHIRTWWSKLLKIKSAAQEKSIPLLLGVLISIIWINLAPDSYEYFLGPAQDHNHPFHIIHDKIFGHHATFLFLINDGFMVFFFGFAAREITDALLPGGSLHPIKKAICPLVATLGGIIGPVMVYLMILNVQIALGAYNLEYNSRETLTNGWATVTPTDIPLACLLATTVFGKGHPAITFLLLLAIADDALGLAIIAIFYPDPHHPVQPVWLCLVLCGMFAAFVLRRFLKCTFWQPYIFVGGFPSWVGLIKAGIHPALALVPIVPFIPGNTLCTHQIPWPCIRKRPLGLHTPLHKFEHDLKDFIDFGLFFFGLANAGVRFSSFGFMTLCVALSLIFGKPLGILSFTYVITRLPGMDHGLATKEITMVACMSGLALTVSLFIAGLCFEHIKLQEQAKLGALLASFFIGASCFVVGKRWDFYSTNPNCEFENEVVKKSIRSVSTKVRFDDSGRAGFDDVNQHHHDAEEEATFIENDESKSEDEPEGVQQFEPVKNNAKSEKAFNPSSVEESFENDISHTKDVAIMELP